MSDEKQTPPAADVPDWAKPENNRLDQTYFNAHGTKTKQVRIPISKPGRTTFFRVHPTLRLDATLVQLKESGEHYLVTPAARPAVLETGELFAARVYFYITRGGTIGLWPVKLPDPDGKINSWHESAHAAAGEAESDWVRIVAQDNSGENNSSGGYLVIVAEGALSDPEWPDRPFAEIIQAAFGKFVVEGPEHELLDKLRGRVG